MSNLQSQQLQILTSRNTDEWYTPRFIIDKVRQVLGKIDLDPASNHFANSWIQANTYYTKEQNGLKQEWEGNVFLNPPFSETGIWTRKLVKCFEERKVYSAIILVNSNLGTSWFEELWEDYPVCCLRKRLRFIDSEGYEGEQPNRSQTIVYLGNEFNLFKQVFSPLGKVIYPEL